MYTHIQIYRHLLLSFYFELSIFNKIWLNKFFIFSFPTEQKLQEFKNKTIKQILDKSNDTMIHTYILKYIKKLNKQAK